MADEPTVDTSGVTRSADGQIVDGQTTQTDQGAQKTDTTQASGTTLLTGTETGADKGKEAATEGDNGKKTEDQGAPEKYEDYKVPDGYALDPEIKTKADALFKGMNLSQEQAQGLVDFYRELTTEAFEAPFKAYQTMKEGWAKEAMDHPDLKGKLGPGKEITLQISKALDGLGDAQLASDFRRDMDITGAGNLPSFIRVLNLLTRDRAEGGHVAGKGPSTHGQSAGEQAAPSAAAAIWPGLPSSAGR